jgi:hypothetical protein
MRSVRVVFPLSIWAEMPMFLSFDMSCATAYNLKKVSIILKKPVCRAYGFMLSVQSNYYNALFSALSQVRNAFCSMLFPKFLMRFTDRVKNKYF